MPKRNPGDTPYVSRQSIGPDTEMIRTGYGVGTSLIGIWYVWERFNNCFSAYCKTVVCNLAQGRIATIPPKKTETHLFARFHNPQFDFTKIRKLFGNPHWKISKSFDVFPSRKKSFHLHQPRFDILTQRPHFLKPTTQNNTNTPISAQLINKKCWKTPILF